MVKYLCGSLAASVFAAAACGAEPRVLPLLTPGAREVPVAVGASAGWPAQMPLEPGEYLLRSDDPMQTAGSQGGCPTEYTVRNTPNAGTVSCPCFAINEEAGVVFEAPAADYPIQIVKVGIGWGSQQGSSPNSLEDSIVIYSGGLPQPGGPLSLPLTVVDSPQMVDGVINNFTLPQNPSPVIVNSGKFTVTLKFANRNLPPPPGLPSVVHDGSGCTPGRNVLRVSGLGLPFGWYDACSLGVSGNWVFQVTYKKVLCPCPGDINGDGVVNFLDLSIVLNGYGTTYGFTNLSAVLGNYGRPC